MIRANRAALAAALPLLAASAFAAEYTRDGGTADWMCCSDRDCVDILSQHADPVRATKACEKLTDADGVTRYVRSNPFRITAGKPAPPPPPPPPVPPPDADGDGVPDAQDSCPSQPAATPDGCPPPVGPEPEPEPEPQPDPTAKPSTPTLTATPSGEKDILLTWTKASGDIREYQIIRCAGPNCSSFSKLADVEPDRTSYLNNNLPVGMTFKYRVRAIAVGSVYGAYSPIAQATVGATPPPAQDPPPASGSGTALLTWTPPTLTQEGKPLTNLAGYRIHYGEQPDMLHRTMQIDVPGATAYRLEGMAEGVWYFAVEAFTADGNRSPHSNVVSKAL